MRDEAGHALEPENALVNQATTHKAELAKLTAKHDDLHAQITVVHNGKSPAGL